MGHVYADQVLSAWAAYASTAADQRKEIHCSLTAGVKKFSFADPTRADNTNKLTNQPVCDLSKIVRAGEAGGIGFAQILRNANRCYM